MNSQRFKSLNELISTYQQGKKFFKLSKRTHKLNYEEIFILNYIYNCNDNEITAKDIAKHSELQPYYLTKALQKLIKMNFLSKKRSEIDERTVVVYVNEQQRTKINEMIATIILITLKSLLNEKLRISIYKLNILKNVNL